MPSPMSVKLNGITAKRAALLLYPRTISRASRAERAGLMVRVHMTFGEEKFKN